MRLVGRLALGLASLLLIGAERPAGIDLPGNRLFPESVTIAGNTAFVSSMTGGIVRVRLGARQTEPWIAPGTFGSGAQFGVFADPRHGLLWSCTNDFAARGVVVPGSDAGAWVKAFDLRTGEGRVSLKLPGARAVCNDFAVTRDGTVLVVDTANPRILRWRPGSQALETWIEGHVFDAPPQGGGLDGIAVGSDGNVYVNNVRSGALFGIGVQPDGSAGTVRRITPSRPLVGPDGMRAVGGMRFVVAEQPGRVTLLEVKGDRAEARTLAEGFTSPTGVAVQGRTVWVVEGQLGALFRPAEPRPTLPFRLTPVRITR